MTAFNDVEPPTTPFSPLGDFDLRAIDDDDPVRCEARPVHALEPARVRAEQRRHEVAVVRRIEVHKRERQGALVDVEANQVVKRSSLKEGQHDERFEAPGATQARRVARTG